MSDTALVVMARYPEPGKTKTRLARVIGDEEAVNLYQAFLTDLAHRFAPEPSIPRSDRVAVDTSTRLADRVAVTARAALSTGKQLSAASLSMACVRTQCDLYWTYTPPDVDYHAYMQALVPACAPYMHYFPQQGADLGVRLLHAFAWTHAHGYQCTIVIASDSPQITPELVTQARTALDEVDVVLGPAEDGGYYLIAMRRPYDLFSSIPMSTPVVLQMTIEAAQRHNLAVRQIDTLFDIDDFADLRHLARLLKADSSLAPATAAYLATMRMYL
jgi:rSAM/selenodomain-associated transferase 1